MVQTIENYKRIGIEAELRTYFFDKKTGSNKMVLAKTSCKVSELGIPYLEIVVEGNVSGSPYMELVFGPVVKDELNIVKEGIIVALETTGTKLSEWIANFNSKLSIEAKNKLGLELEKSDYKFRRGCSNAVSIQANILVPLGNLSNKSYLDKYFEGYTILTKGEGSFIKKVSSSLDSENMTDIDGALFLTAYICYIYARINKSIITNIDNKQVLYILPKVDLKDLLSVLLVNTDQINSFCTQLENILSKFKSDIYLKCFKKNINTVENILKKNKTTTICPNLLNLTKDIFVNNDRKYIVLEFRKTTTLALLRQISGYLTTNPEETFFNGRGIW